MNGDCEGSGTFAARSWARRPIFLSISPLNQDRSGLAPYWGEQDNQPLPPDWEGLALDDAKVVKAYTRFVLESVRRLQPAYLAVGIELNVLLSKNPNAWPELKRLYRATYRAVKARYPRLPVFFTTEVLHYKQLAQEARGKPHAIEVADLMRDSDLFAMSLYPHMSTEVPRPFPDDFLAFALQFGKPVAVAEMGMTSRDVVLPSYRVTLRGSAREQAQFIDTVLRRAARDRYCFVINFASTDFEPLVRRLPQPVAELASIWAFTGLQTSGGLPKPALAVWNRWLRLPLQPACPATPATESSR